MKNQKVKQVFTFKRIIIYSFIFTIIVAMSFYTKLATKAQRIINAELGIRLNKKEGKLLNTKPMITFTFDDFPTSAFEAGNVLKENNGRGTYYTCLNLMDSLGADKEPFYNFDQFKQLIADGHEIGSHTYAHINCKESSVGNLQSDLEMNQKALDKLLPGYKMKNFAFPFGEFSLYAKGVTGKTYTSSRSIIPGINTGTIDLNLLKANKLYNNIPVEDNLKLIEENKEKNGWLIFYTHDVKENPSIYGCSPAYFEKVVKAAAASGAEIVTIEEALKRVRVSE